eukprot:15451004-Alexandrium_andersonii.AAC.1
MGHASVRRIIRTGSSSCLEPWLPSPFIAAVPPVSAPAGVGCTECQRRRGATVPAYLNTTNLKLASGRSGSRGARDPQR